MKPELEPQCYIDKNAFTNNITFFVLIKNWSNLKYVALRLITIPHNEVPYKRKNYSEILICLIAVIVFLGGVLLIEIPWVHMMKDLHNRV